MILFQNHLVVLDYEPTTDIISVVWPSLDAYDLLELERITNVLVDHIRDYDIKRLLIDSRYSTTHSAIDQDAYKKILTMFTINLQKTRLKKSVSILQVDDSRIAHVDQISEEVAKQVKLNFQYRYFTDKNEATLWLLDKN